MSFDPSGVPAVGAAGSVRPPRGERRPPAPETHLDLSRLEGDTRTGVLAALSRLREDLGFDSASLFVPSDRGWELLERDGRVQAWHGVLDPGAIDGLDQPAEYPDVRAIPGVGARLAKLGCRSLAALPLPDGGRIILDSSTRRETSGWIERARPYLDLMALTSGPGWPGEGVLRGHHETAAIQRVFTFCQNLLEYPGASMEGLLDGVREAIRADELFVVVDRDTELSVLASPADSWPRRLPAELRAALAPGDNGSLDQAGLQRLAIALGVASQALVGAIGRDDHEREAVLAGWRDGVALSPTSMVVVARALCTARVALRDRRTAVTKLMREERERMAYALHDDLTQTVTSAVLELEALKSRIERNPDEAVSTLETSKSEIRRALSDLRAMLFDLQKNREEERKPEPLTTYVQDVLKRWRLPARVQVDGDLSKVPSSVLSVAYVVIREALANAAKHSATSNVTVSLTATDVHLEVVVADSGRGFTGTDERAARRDHHFGLDMISRRVTEVGGTFDVESTPGRGTKVVARFPMREVTA